MIEDPWIKSLVVGTVTGLLVGGVVRLSKRMNWSAIYEISAIIAVCIACVLAAHTILPTD